MINRNLQGPSLRGLARLLRDPLSLIPAMLKKSPLAEGPGDRHVSETREARECRALMSSVIEEQIIPRLLLAHPVKTAETGLIAQDRHPTDKDISEFIQCCLQPEVAPSQNCIERLLDKGFSHEDIFLHLITPAARQVGRQWEDDSLDFMEVTAALLKMHQVTHELGYQYQDGPQMAGHQSRIMLLSAPGSQHILGLTMVSEFFRKAGWQVAIDIATTQEELAAAIAHEWFDVVGISVALDQQLEGLAGLISRLRQASKNPELGVLLGGPIFTLRALEPRQFGANEICTDPRIAVKLALAMKSACGNRARQ